MVDKELKQKCAEDTFIYSPERFGDTEKYSDIAKEADSLYQYMYQDDEIVQLMEFLDENLTDKNCGFIEIGSALGGSFHCIASIISGGKKISIDMDLMESKTPYPVFVNLEGYLEYRENTWSNHFNDVSVIIGDSTDDDVYDRIESILEDDEIGFLFIDGNHGYKHIKSDTITYTKFVNKNGIIGYHDIFGRYRKFWGMLVHKYPDNCIEIVSKTTGDNDEREYEKDREDEKVKGPGIGILLLNKEIKEYLLTLDVDDG